MCWKVLEKQVSIILDSCGFGEMMQQNLDDPFVG